MVTETSSYHIISLLKTREHEVFSCSNLGIFSSPLDYTFFESHFLFIFLENSFSFESRNTERSYFFIDVRN